MRYLVSFIILTVVSSGAYASKTVSGVVAVSTGPMKAVTQSVDRNLTAGDDVFMNDEVETGAKTRAQVLLRDESVFSMAPSSRIVFDEFVYDPTVGEGSLQASLVKGGLRFVSGQLSNNRPENIKIKADHHIPVYILTYHDIYHLIITRHITVCHVISCHAISKHGFAYRVIS